jgi:hypothetical protein
MRQKYKVFTEQGGILICDSRKNNLPPKASCSFYDFPQFSAFVGQNIIEVYAENPKIRYRELFSSFNPIRAAGGHLIFKQELSECKWVPINELDCYLGQTFISIRELLVKFNEVNNLDR